MNSDRESVEQAKQSFDRILDNRKYAGIIKDDNHLALLLSLADCGGTDRVLDIGTGTGYLAFALAERFPEARVCGIDIAKRIVEKNNAAALEKGLHNLTFEAFDGLMYPFPEESFDLIVTRYAFHHFPNAADSAAQMNRLLRAGGRVLVSDPLRNEADDSGIIDGFMRVKQDGHIRFYNTEELEGIFAENGFMKEKQVITEMSFPFPQRTAYIELYDKIGDKDRQLYDMGNENGVVWVKHIAVGNIVFVKQ